MDVLPWRRPIVMRERVLLQRKGRVADTWGAAEEGWMDVATVWAKVTEGTGGELIEGEAQLTRAPLAVTIRYRSDIDASWRLIWNPGLDPSSDPLRGTIYDLEDEPRDVSERRQYLMLRVEEVD